MKVAWSLLRAIGRVGALLVTALGMLVLAAWSAGEWRTATLGGGPVPMAPITALLFVLLGLSLVTIAWRPESAFGRGASALTSLLTLGVSFLVGLQTLRPLALPWDTWFLEGPTHSAGIPIGRMSPLTAVAFSFAALSLLATSRASWGFKARAAGILLSCACLLIGVVVLLGYLSGTPLLFDGRTIPVAVPTAAGLVALGFALLFGGRASEPLRGDGQAATEPEEASASRRELVAAFTIGALVMLAAFFYLRQRQTVAREATRQQLGAISQLKAAQIGSWRDERLAEARFLLRTRAVARDVEAFLARPTSDEARTRLIDWLEPLRGDARYESAIVYDTRGTPLLATPSTATPPAPVPLAAFKNAVVSQDVVVADLYRERGGRVYLDLLAPIRGAARPRTASTAPSPPIAIIVLRLDPNHSLFPLLREWPIPSETAEAMLVRGEGEDVVYLSELRHQRDAALTLGRSVSEPFLGASMGLRSGMEVREGLDYRGVAVLTVGRLIPRSPWLLVTKVDLREAHGPIQREAAQAGTAFALLFMTLLLGAVLASRERRASFLRRALLAEQERSTAAERLTLVMRHANDIILLCDETGRILETNHRALSAYGYTIEELQALPVGGLQAPDAVEEERDLGELTGSEEGAIFDTVHRARDGALLAVEVSGRAVSVGGRRYRLKVVRDITERKKHEAEILRLNRLYAALSQVSQTIVHAVTREELLGGVCRNLVESGRFVMARVGWHNRETSEVEPVAESGDVTGYVQSLRIRIDDSGAGDGPIARSVRYGRTIVCNDFLNDPDTAPWHEAARRAGFQASIALPIRRSGEVAGALIVYAGVPGSFGDKEIALLEEAAIDIAFGLDGLDRDASRRHAEETARASLREKEALLREVHHRVKNNLQVISSLLRLEGSRSAELSTRAVLKDMQGRIRSMALLHETLYRTGNFARVDLAEYLRQLATQLFRAQNSESSPVRLEMDLGEARVEIDQAIPCGLIVNELMTNCMKYAFATGHPGTVRLTVKPEPAGMVRLCVSDDGIGLPRDFETRRDRSLGLQLVSDLARQVGASLEIGPAPGASFTVLFKTKVSPPEPVAQLAADVS